MEKVTGSVYGIKKPEPNDSGFPCSGGTNILTLASLGQDGRYWGLNKEKLRTRSVPPFYIPICF